MDGRRGRRSEVVKGAKTVRFRSDQANLVCSSSVVAGIKSGVKTDRVEALLSSSTRSSGSGLQVLCGTVPTPRNSSPIFLSSSSPSCLGESERLLPSTALARARQVGLQRHPSGSDAGLCSVTTTVSSYSGEAVALGAFKSSALYTDCLPIRKYSGLSKQTALVFRV